MERITGEGDGRFGKAQLVPVTGFPYRLMPGKINGNGPADLVYLEMDSGKAVLLDFRRDYPGLQSWETGLFPQLWLAKSVMAFPRRHSVRRFVLRLDRLHSL